MGKIATPRYFVAKRQKSRTLFYWQPGKTLRAAGWIPRRLAERTNDVVEAFREAEAANRELDQWRGGKVPVVAGPGTLPDLIRRYQQTKRWTRLGAETQRNYSYRLRALEAWSARAGHPPITSISRKHVRALHEFEGSDACRRRRPDDGAALGAQVRD